MNVPVGGHSNLYNVSYKTNVLHVKPDMHFCHWISHYPQEMSHCSRKMCCKWHSCFKCLVELYPIKGRENRIKDREECMIPMVHLKCDILRFSHLRVRVGCHSNSITKSALYAGALGFTLTISHWECHCMCVQVLIDEVAKAGSEFMPQQFKC